MRGCRGRLGLADRAEERCGSGTGEEHSGATGTDWGPGDRTERRCERIGSDIGNIRGKVGEARLGDRSRSGRKAASGRKGQESCGLWVRPVFHARAVGRTRTKVRPDPDRNYSLFAAPTPPCPRPSPSPATTGRSPCDPCRIPVRFVTDSCPIRVRLPAISPVTLSDSPVTCAPPNVLLTLTLY